MSTRVYKVGGPALEDPDLVAPLAAELRRAGGSIVLIHGGGRQIDRTLQAQGAESRFLDGRRFTTPEAMQAVEMVLSGAVNKRLAAGLTAAGLPSVGLSGRDGGLLRARQLPDIGCVGRPASVAPEVLRALLAAGFVPVVSPVSAGPSGETLNVNADEAALAIAQALDAESLVYLSDVDGVCLDGSPQSGLTEDVALRRIADGTIAGGMAMKVRTALEACAAGIPEVVIAGRARLLGGFPGTAIQAAGVAA